MIAPLSARPPMSIRESIFMGAIHTTNVSLSAIHICAELLRFRRRKSAAQDFVRQCFCDPNLLGKTPITRLTLVCFTRYLIGRATFPRLMENLEMSRAG